MMISSARSGSTAATNMIYRRACCHHRLNNNSNNTAGMLIRVQQKRINSTGSNPVGPTSSKLSNNASPSFIPPKTTKTSTANITTAATTITTTGGSSSSSSSNSKNFFWSMWEGYTALLFARPLTVKATTASIIFFISDSATQMITSPNSSWDVSRAGSGAAFGIVATGWLHHWWGFLEAFVGKRVPIATNKLKNTLIKVFLDQAIGAPLYIYTYYVITNFIQDMKKKNIQTKEDTLDSFQTTCDKASDMLMPTMLRHWTLWPAVHTLNFYYSPLHHRVLVQNLVLVGWSGYLSHLNNGGLMTPKEEVEETIKRRDSIIVRRRTTTTTKVNSEQQHQTPSLQQEGKVV